MHNGRRLGVMRAVHRVGLRSSATMMFGIGDRIQHRVRHLQRLRDLQDETGGFTAFIPWTFQRENTALGRRIKDEPTGIDYLKMLAVSVLFLDRSEEHTSELQSRSDLVCRLLLEKKKKKKKQKIKTTKKTTKK